MIPRTPEEDAISAAITLLDGDLDHQNAETMRALLSKLRAPVADERAAFARHVSGRDDLEIYQVENVIDANLTRWTTWRAARDYYQQARATLASAPVAGESVNLQAAREYLDQWGCLANPNVRALLENAEHAAPQASEAMREALQQSFDMGKFYGSLPEVDTVEVRNAALEEAATECESWLMTKTHSDLGNMANQTMERMARLIRALKTQPQVDKGGAENTVDGKGFSGFANSENAAQSGGAETGYNSPESRANPHDTVVLPPLGKPPGRGLYHTHKEIQDYARAAVLADRQQRAGDDIAKGLQEAAISLETISQRAGNSGGDKTDIRLFAASRARIARAALSAQPGAQKYWLCCGSKDPNHSNRRAPDCFNPEKAKWGTADQHSAAQKKGGSDA